MRKYREIRIDDIGEFWRFMNRLDQETRFMMYEPGERKKRVTEEELGEDIRNCVIEGEDFLKLAVEGEKIVGYLRAERGRYNRIRHTAYLVVGILEKYRGLGICTALFQYLEQWAKEEGIVRLELTVEICNQAAKHLYEKNGFEVEGIRRKSMYVKGQYMDEYYMAKILS